MNTALENKNNNNNNEEKNLIGKKMNPQELLTEIWIWI